MKSSSRPPRTPSRFPGSCTFLLVACLLLSGVSSAAPCITLSKKSGPPTSRILVSGRGFAPNVGVDIYFDTKDEALVVTNGKGEFKDAKAYAPRSAPPGKHWVTALERDNDKGAQKPFLVQTDWSQFHFDADGTRLNPYENVLNPKTVPGLDLKWSYATPDYVKSAPAVADGVVYVVSTGGMYALNGRTGVLLWSYPAGGFSSPAVANESVYVGCAYSVCALNRETGSLLWFYDTGDWVYSSPAVANGVVYVGSDGGNVYALNAGTGVLLWNYAADYSVYSSPAVANGVLYFGSGSDNTNVYALNASTGALLWSYAAPYGVASSPAVANGIVYVASVYSLFALNATTGAELWEYSIGSEIESSPARVRKPHGRRWCSSTA